MAVKRLHQKNLLCICWNCKGSMYSKSLQKNETINSEKYCVQLNNLKATMQEKHPALANKHGIVFHQDNARPPISVNTLQNISLYSDDIMPSDYYLFRSLELFVSGKNLANLNNIKNYLDIIGSKA